MTIMVMEEEFRRMWAEKYSKKLIQNVDDKLDDADDKGKTGWLIVVESPPTIQSSTSSAVLRNPPVETADRRPIAVLYSAPPIPVGLRSFRWNPVESGGMGPESTGIHWIPPDSTGFHWNKTIIQNK